MVACEQEATSSGASTQPLPRLECRTEALPPGRCLWGSARWGTTSASRFLQHKLPFGKKAQAGDRRKEGDQGPLKDDSKGTGPPQGQHSLESLTATCPGSQE